MKKVKKAKQTFVAAVIVRDDNGVLGEQDFYMSPNDGVTVVTRMHLGGKPLAVAGVLLTGAHALLEAANAPAKLTEDVLSEVLQVQALIEVREMAKKQESQDLKDHGSLDDWPASDDSEVPF